LALLLQHLVFDHLACVALVEASLVLLCGLLFQTQPPVVLHLSFDGGLALQLKLLHTRTWQVDEWCKLARRGGAAQVHM